MPKKKVEVYDKDKLIYPFIENDHVTFSNGMKVSEMLDQGISMPTITHNETSFKVGVGDSDVSSSIVDSSVSKMVIKGQTYQNILPEPSTHVLTNNKEIFKVNEGLDPNVEIVDAVSKSAILKGQTLVNLGLNNIISFSFNGEFLKKELIKPNTEYTLIYEVAEVSENVTTTNVPMFTETVLPFGKGIHKIKRTTVSNISDTVFKIWGNDTNERTITIKNLIVIEGDYTNLDIPYFEGMQSVKMPVLTTTGSNMVNPTDIEVIGCNSYDVDSDGIANIVGDTTGYWARSYIRYAHHLKANTTYYIYCDGDSTGTIHAQEWIDNINTGRFSWSKFYSYTPKADVLYEVRIFLSADESPFTCSKIRIGIFESTTKPSSFEPYKSNILSTPEDLELRGIGDVKDTLDLTTDELTERIGEIVLDGSEGWSKESTNNTSGDTDTTTCYYTSINDIKLQSHCAFACKELPYRKVILYHKINDYEGISKCLDDKRIFIRINQSRLTEQNVNGFKQWLSQNPITIQYELATPTVKTVDLTTSGNWEKVVLDGSESWNGFDASYGCAYTGLTNKAYGFSNVFAEGFSTMSNYANAPLTISGTPNNSAIWLSIGKSIATLDQFKHYLSQNPITVWYQTQTHQDSTQVKQPIFFKDGHIQLSSGADNSLIPTLDYQAKTKNSYVMDLMKPNTIYTMKLKSGNGAFVAQGGQSIGFMVNRTFNSGNLPNDKLFYTTGWVDDLMILEGDLTSKTIPYFKGIKSAFENESKIEVLSTGKNLFDMNRCYDNITNAQATVVQNVDKITVSSVEDGTYVNANFVLDKNFFKGKTVVGSCLYESDEKGIGTVQINYQDTTGKKYYQSIKTSRTFTFPDEFVGEVLLCVYANNTNTPQSNTVTVRNIQLELGTKSTTYDSHNSNVTKIPLLSPLRSLPNGVCDEINLDRERNKATLIQRSESVIFNGSENWDLNEFSHDKLIEFVCHSGTQINDTIFSDRFVTGGNNVERVAFSGGSIYIRISKTKVGDVNSFKQWLSQNPLTVQYGLKTPIITEVDLEGFPYIYKDGYIFLNSEIAPTMEITYSINQGQQISASNEDIIRHEKELTYLQKLIAQYVQVNYESVLLSLKV